MPRKNSSSSPILTAACYGVVTIDVEPDNVWTNTRSATLSNLRRLPLFHKVCQHHGVRPTYLITWSVARDAEGASLIEGLMKNNDCEVGIHPHLWETPPFLPQDVVPSQAWVGSNYPSDALEAKLATLTDLVRGRFGAPISHRAGRFGLDLRQVGMLLRQRVLVDSSVTPGLDWSATGAPDYSAAPVGPYQLRSKTPESGRETVLWEVPCTIRPGWRCRRMERTTLGRAIANWLRMGPTWLRCHPSAPMERLHGVCAWAQKRDLPLNLMSHSSEFSAGCSPYWRDEAAVEQHLRQCGQIFSWWQRNGVRPVTLSEFHVNLTRRAAATGSLIDRQSQTSAA